MQRFSGVCLLGGSCFVWIAYQLSAYNMDGLYKVVSEVVVLEEASQEKVE